MLSSKLGGGHVSEKKEAKIQQPGNEGQLDLHSTSDVLRVYTMLPVMEWLCGLSAKGT